MNYEIEKKYLVPNINTFNELIENNKQELIKKHIIQGYISQGYNGNDYFRVRVVNQDSKIKAYTTIKKPTENPEVREEIEDVIDLVEANKLLNLCDKFVIKDRYVFPYEGKNIELDVFHGENEGLILLEIELEYFGETFKLPPTTDNLLEVTTNSSYHNENLANSVHKKSLKYGF